MIKADDTVAAAKEGLEIFRKLNSRPGMAMAYSNLARWETVHGDFQKGEEYMALVMSHLPNGAISFQTGFNNLGMGISARLQGHFESAMRYFGEGFRVFQQMRHKGMMAIMSSEIAHTQRAQGLYPEAKRTYRETIKVFQDHGNLPAVAHQLECFAMIAIVEEDAQRAAILFGAADAVRERTGHRRTDEEEAEETQFMSRLRSMLPEAELHALWADGKAMPMEQAIELALS
jgi:tetratricopeptide (TPR) repeat protein